MKMASVLKKIFRKRTKSITDESYEYKRGDYDRTFVIPKKILRLLTIQMTHRLTPTASMFWDWFYWFEFVNMALALASEFLSMMETARGGSFQDALKIFRMMPCFGMVVLALAKSWTMVRHRSVYENLVNEVGDMWPRGTLPAKERTVVSNALKQLMFVTKGYYWCNNALLISFLWPPIGEGLKRAFGYDNEMLLQFFYWLPFDPFQPGYIDVLLIMQTWHAIVVVWSNLCSDLLFCIFLSHITTQFDLLSIRIQRLVYVPVDRQLIDSYPLSAYSKEFVEEKMGDVHLNDAEWEKIHLRELAQIIQRHEALIRLSGDVERMFSFALLMNFVNSSIIICFCGFCCIVVEQWNKIAYKSFLLTALSQTYLICWYGQKLLDSSRGVAEAIYKSGWYKASGKIKKSMIIMMHRSQKEVHITTYGFSVVSLLSYTKIIKTAWSYFTLLLNTYKQ